MILILLDHGVFGGGGNKVTVNIPSGFVTVGDKTTSFKDGAFTVAERPDGEYPVHIVTDKGKRIECDPVRFVGGKVVPTTPPSTYHAYKLIKGLNERFAKMEKDFSEIKEKYGEISLF